MKKIITLIFIGITVFCNAQSMEEIFAGSIEPGNSDGITGDCAKFGKPLGIAKDLNGFIYVADTGSNNIKKIAPDGSLTIVIAGSTISAAGNNDGVGTAARFSKPGGIFVDAEGNVFVADTGNNRIRKITPNGTVSTIAGSSRGTLNGIGVAARFDSPYGLTIDTFGNIYVAESKIETTGGGINGSIRKITPTGLVSTFYTTGSSEFQPTGVAIDSNNNIYISDSGSNTVLKINSNGQLIKSFNLGYPQWGITLDSTGNIFCTLRIPNPGAVKNPAYNPAYSYPSIGRISLTGYVTIEPTDVKGAFGLFIDNNNNIFIADSQNNLIVKKTSPEGSTITVAGVKTGYDLSCASTPSGGLGEINKAHFNGPGGLGRDSYGNIYVADTYNHSIRKIAPNGIVSTLVGSIEGNVNGNANQALLSYPSGISIDANNYIYTRTYSDGKIKKISPTGDVAVFPESNPNLQIRSYEFLGTGKRYYSGIVVDKVGNVYVTNYDEIKKITPSGTVSTFAGSTAGYINAIGTAAKFNSPRGLCIDALGNIYVADSGNNRIRKIDPNGLVTTLAPQSPIVFDAPNGVAYNGENIYVSEGNCSEMCSSNLKKITADGEVSIISGGGGGAICAGSDCMYVVRCNRINIVKDQTLATNQNLFTESLIKIYPNPVKDQITIDCGNLSNVIGGNFKIVNTLGQEVLNGKLSSQQNIVNLNTIIFQGIFFVKIYDNSKKLIYTRKIIVQK